MSQRDDAIMKRAQRLLDTYRPPRPATAPSVAPSLRSAHDKTIAMVLPPVGVAVQAAEDRKRAERLRANPPRRRDNNLMKRA